VQDLDEWHRRATVDLDSALSDPSIALTADGSQLELDSLRWMFAAPGDEVLLAAKLLARLWKFQQRIVGVDVGRNGLVVRPIPQELCLDVFVVHDQVEFPKRAMPWSPR
jgi:hypothetical protein